MMLTKEEQEICQKHSELDESGKVHCSDCPLAADTRNALCKANMTVKEWTEHLKMKEDSNAEGRN